MSLDASSGVAAGKDVIFLLMPGMITATLVASALLVASMRLFEGT